MRPGHAYGSFQFRDGRGIVLRALSMRDLVPAVSFVNTLVRERETNRDLGVLMDRRVSRRSEGEWLRGVTAGIRRGNVFSVAAFHEGRLVGNSEVHRARQDDIRHTGVLGIAIVEGYRGGGLGRRMLRLLLETAAKGGVTLVELRVLSINEGAIRLYRHLGFKDVGRLPGKIVRDGRRIDEILMLRQA